MNGVKSPNAQRSSSTCRVVVGAESVASLRAAEPHGALVAVVDGASLAESVLAQAAGADIVLALPQQIDEREHDAAIDLATRAATAIAHRRDDLSATARRAGHDVAQALNVIGLAAEAGRSGRLDPVRAFEQIAELARDAGVDAWRAGRPARSSSLVLTVVDLRRLCADGVVPDDVDLTISEGEVLVLADERRLTDAIAELIRNARRSGADRILVDVCRAGEDIAVVVSDDGHGFPVDHEVVVGRPFSAPPGSDRLGLGLAGISEMASELGGRLEVVEPGRDGRCTQVALSLPAFGDRVATTTRPVTVDQATAQADILEGVVRHAPLEESLEAIVGAIEQQLPGAVCSVLLLHEGRWLGHGAGARLPLAYREAIDGVTIGIGQGSCGTAAFTGRPVIASDVTVDPNWVDFRDLAVEHGLRSCWSTPIVAAEGGETLGTFAVYTSRVWRPDQGAIRLVNRFTYLAAVAIEHHRLFGALAESEARFRGAFEGAAAGIALAGLDGTILKSNPSMSDVVRRSGVRLAGSNLLDLVDPSHRHLVTDAWSELIASDTPTPDSVEVQLCCAPGATIEPLPWLSLHTSLIPGEPDRAPYLYVEIRDVTAARHQLADLRAREAAEAANRAKTDFLALASHELRTPLNAILGFAQVMQLLELDTDQREDGVEQIVRAGRHLRDLIDELLDLSRIEAGQLAVDAVPVDLALVVDEALELVRPLAAARDIELVDRTSPSTALHARADHRCVRQVLINLLDNAVKYTPAGGRVEIACASSDDGRRISVTDTGPGISPESLGDVFEPFHRLDGNRDDSCQGTGLGLTLCARLMREMRGSIDVDSTVGVGTTFWIDLPAVVVDRPIIERNPMTLRPPVPDDVVPGTVLYVDDDPACVEVMRAAFGLRPHLELQVATTAADGASAMAAAPADVVLLDIGLPDRPGWELLTEFRSEHPEVPVIVLTAGPDSVPIEVSAAPERIFTKPLDVGDVLLAIDDVCAVSARDDDRAEAVHAINQ